MPVRSVLYSKWSDVKQFISCKYIIIGTSICNYVLFIAPTKRVILAGKVRTRSALRESSRGLGYTPEGGIVHIAHKFKQDLTIIAIGNLY